MGFWGFGVDIDVQNDPDNEYFAKCEKLFSNQWRLRWPMYIGSIKKWSSQGQILTRPFGKILENFIISCTRYKILVLELVRSHKKFLALEFLRIFNKYLKISKETRFFLIFPQVSWQEFSLG